MTINHIWKFIKKIRPSHLIWLSVGTLIPMYADVLFINGITSSTISAVMDTVMATTAVVVALSWFYQKKKLNILDTAHKVALEHNDLCWKILEYYQSILSFYHEIESLKNEHNYINADPEITRKFMIKSQNEYIKIKSDHLIISSKINHFNIKIESTFFKKEMIEHVHKFTSRHQSIIMKLYGDLLNKEADLRIDLNPNIKKIISSFYDCGMTPFVMTLEENLNEFKIGKTYTFN